VEFDAGFNSSFESVMKLGRMKKPMTRTFVFTNRKVGVAQLCVASRLPGL